MLRNVASQKWRVYAWDVTTGLAKTGDAANISARIQKDDGAEAATNDAAPTEVQATNQPGYYDFDMTQAETAAAKLSLSPKSSTANIQVIACPPVVYTRPQFASLQTVNSDGSTEIGTDGELVTNANPVPANQVQIGGDAQSSTDLKDFADSGYDPSTNKVQGVVLVDTTTTNTDMRGTDNAATAAEMAKVPKSDSNVTWNATALGSIQSESNDALVAFFTSAANLVDLIWDELKSGHTTPDSFGDYLDDEVTSRSSHSAADVWAAVARTLTAIDEDSTTLDIDAAVSAAVTTALTTALTEGYRATGATGSARDLLYEIIAHLGEFAISGTTKTTKKLDGTTTAKTYTLDDDTTPTAITEAT